MPAENEMPENEDVKKKALLRLAEEGCAKSQRPRADHRRTVARSAGSRARSPCHPP